jgi:hypothetical protein
MADVRKVLVDLLLDPDLVEAVPIERAIVSESRFLRALVPKHGIDAHTMADKLRWTIWMMKTSVDGRALHHMGSHWRSATFFLSRCGQEVPSICNGDQSIVESSRKSGDRFACLLTFHQRFSDRSGIAICGV